MYKIIIRLIIIATSVSFIAAACSCPCNTKVSSPDEIVAQCQEGLKMITTEELHVMMDSLDVFYLIDVREMDEYAYGFIPGAINIPGGVLIAALSIATPVPSP